MADFNKELSRRNGLNPSQSANSARDAGDSPPASGADTSTRSRRKAPPALPQDAVSTSAAARATPERVAKARDRAILAARLADDNRGKDILLLDLRAATPLIDFFVIVSANSRRQAYAISSEIDQEMKKLGESKLGIEGAEEGRWILTDYGDFVVHVFSEDARTYYALEEIWGDADRVEWRDPARARPTAPRVAEEPIPHHIDDLIDDELPQIEG